MQNNKVKRIQDFGQHIWLDFFDREIMDSGKLKKLIDEDGVSGVTSNPSIFEKSITSSLDYDEDIAILSRKENSNEAIFFSLAVKDIKRAADFFKKINSKTNGEDGFVSIEVSPWLANDTDGTIKQAKELWDAVNRKNVMIKIPATEAGLPAIRKCISEGMNINITLLFGLPRYMKVVDAYLSGLEDRVNAGLPINQIASVASFFLSRIDVLVDPFLEKAGLSDVKGEVAIASAKKAYHIYKNTFSSSRFKKLEVKGAKRQRVLWASTSSKNPSFSDVKYVEALIGDETINTIPMETLIAFNDHGRAGNTLEGGMDKATAVLSRLNASGIDIDVITQKLEDEGIEKFNKAYDNLLKAIEKKKNTKKNAVKQFGKLTDEERELLFKAPVLVSVLASSSFNKVNKSQKADAIKLAHLKTFTAHPLLLPYYGEVEKDFKEAFEIALKKYFPFDEAKRDEIKKEMAKISWIMNKLDKGYAEVLGTSFERYARHVTKAGHSIFEDFIFPVPIKGLTY